MANVGWYLDSEASGGERYWDGARWTEHRRPAAPVAPARRQPAPTSVAAAPSLPAPPVGRPAAGPSASPVPLLSRTWFLAISILAELIVFGSIARAGGTASPVATVAGLLAVAAIVTSIVLFRRGRPARHQRARRPKADRARATKTAGGQAAGSHVTVVTRAREEVDAAKSLGTEKLAMLGTHVGLVVLTPLTIRTPRGEIDLEPSIKVTVATAGNIATNTLNQRVLWRGYQATKVHDARELYLEIEGSRNAVSLPCNPRDGAKVREFAAMIRRKASTVEESRASIDRQVSIAMQHLKVATAEAQAEAVAAVALDDEVRDPPPMQG